MLIVAGFGLADSINSSNYYVYHIQDKYQQKLILGSAIDGLDKTEIEKRADVNQWIMEKAADFKNDGLGKKGLLTVVGNGNLLYFEDQNKNPVEISDKGAAITRKLADKIGVGTGDETEVHIIGTQLYYAVKIENIIYSPSPQGIFVTQKYFEGIDGKFIPTSTLVANKEIAVSYSDISSVQEIVTIEVQEENMNTMSQSVMTVIKLLIIASLMLSVVILYNLGALNFVERYREYATMKVLGFYQKEIRSLMLRENILILVVGIAIGIPVSLKFLKEYIGIIAFDSFEWIPQIDPFSFSLCVAIIITCSVVVTLLLSHKVSKIIMVEALKSIE
jgi:putative ABC transport system permease protein